MQFLVSTCPPVHLLQAEDSSDSHADVCDGHIGGEAYHQLKTK